MSIETYDPVTNPLAPRKPRAQTGLSAGTGDANYSYNPGGTTTQPVKPVEMPKHDMDGEQLAAFNANQPTGDLLAQKEATMSNRDIDSGFNHYMENAGLQTGGATTATRPGRMMDGNTGQAAPGDLNYSYNPSNPTGFINPTNPTSPNDPVDPEQQIDPGGEAIPLDPETGEPTGPEDPGEGGWPEGPPIDGVETNPARTPEKEALIAQLQARAAQSTDVSGDDPFIRRQADAYNASEERARRRYLSEQAESNSPYNTGHQRGLERMTAEGVGQRAGQFESQLIVKELESRRAEIQHALDSMGNLLSEEEKSNLERELANLGLSIERSKMGMQNAQFFAGLGQADKQFYAQLAQGDRFFNMDDTFRRMESAQQNAQFMAKLAQDGDIAKLALEFDKAKLSQDDKQFLMQLAQDGKFKEMEDAFKKLALSQDQNQFVANLAQTGKLAEMDDLFRKMKLMQEQSQFLDRLGLDIDQQNSYWEWLNRGGSGG